MMGCFATLKAEKRRYLGAPRSSRTSSAATGGVVPSKARPGSSLLANKPAVLPDPDHVLPRPGVERWHSYASDNEQHWTSTTDASSVSRSRFSREDLRSDDTTALSDCAPSARARIRNRGVEGRAAFSGPLASSAAHNEAVIGLSRLQPGRAVNDYASDVEGAGQAKGLRMLRRTASFGGRPQPLPRIPIAEDEAVTPPNPKQQMVYNLPLPAPEDAATSAMPTSRFAPAGRTRSFKLEAGSARGRVTPVGGLPLPPPSLATNLSPSLAAFEFRHLVLATGDFAASCCVSRSTSGDVFRARIEDSSATSPHTKLDVAVLRLPDNDEQGATEWKSDVQFLAQVSHPNVCAVKGYCNHDAAGSRLSPKARRQERLLVFELPRNGSLHDHLFGTMSSLDWTMRVNIALGVARGLLYIHDRAPLQIIYKEFTASNVLLEEDHTPKLAGYGMSVTVPLLHRSSSFTTSMMLSQSQAKHNVRSFGVLLLELLTGKNSRDAMYLESDANFLQWGRQFTKEESQLELITDPRMKEDCPMKGATELASLLLQCASKREAQRPSMAEVVGALKAIQARHCQSKAELPESLKPEARPEAATQSQESHTHSNTALSPSDASSSENDDFAMSKRLPGV